MIVLGIMREFCCKFVYGYVVIIVIIGLNKSLVSYVLILNKFFLNGYYVEIVRFLWFIGY